MSMTGEEAYILSKKYVDRIIKDIQDPPNTSSEHIYGVSWNKGSDPTLTRIYDSVGMVANAGVDSIVVQNDFDTAQIYKDITEVTDSLGNVFVRIPKFYIHKTDTSSLKTWAISRYKYPGFYLPWCFWDFINNRELPYVDIGKYKANLGAGNRLESKPNTEPLVDTSIVDMRTYARNNNVDGLLGYQQLDIHIVDVLQTLFYIEFATLDSQSVMRGWVDGRLTDTDSAVISETGVNRIVVSNEAAANYSVGQPIGIGTTNHIVDVCNARHITSIEDYDASSKAVYFDGDPVNISVTNKLKNSGWRNGFSGAIAATSGSITSNADGKYPCMYRGIESPWGDVWNFVDGININNRKTWYAKDAENYASNVFAIPYESVAYNNSSTSNQYTSQMGFDYIRPEIAMPVATVGSGTTYYADYYFSEAGYRIALVGGLWIMGSDAGISCWAIYDNASGSVSYFGGRLAKKAL